VGEAPAQVPVVRRPLGRTPLRLLAIDSAQGGDHRDQGRQLFRRDVALDDAEEWALRLVDA